MLPWLITAISLGLAAAFIARGKGRPFGPWLIYGLLLGIVALPHALLLRSNDEEPYEADDPDAQWDAGRDTPPSFLDTGKSARRRSERVPNNRNVTAVWSEDDFARIAGTERSEPTIGEAWPPQAEPARAAQEQESAVSGKGRSVALRMAQTPRRQLDPSASEPEPTAIQGTSPESEPPGRTPEPESEPKVERETTPESAPPRRTPEPAPEPEPDLEPELEPEPESDRTTEAEEDDWPDLDLPPPPPVDEPDSPSRDFPYLVRARGGKARPGEEYGAPHFRSRTGPHFGFEGRAREEDVSSDEAWLARHFAPDPTYGRSSWKTDRRRGKGAPYWLAAAGILLAAVLGWPWLAERVSPPLAGGPQTAATNAGDPGPAIDVPPLRSAPVQQPPVVGNAGRAGSGDSVGRTGRESDVPVAPEERQTAAVPLPPTVGADRTSEPSFPENVTPPKPPSRGTATESQPPKKSESGATARARQDRGTGSGPSISAAGQVVVLIQAELKKRGYDLGRVDGLAGERTQQAILAFKRDRGLTPNSKIDDDLLQHLGIDGPRLYPFTRNAPPGSASLDQDG